MIADADKMLVFSTGLFVDVSHKLEEKGQKPVCFFPLKNNEHFKKF